MKKIPISVYLIVSNEEERIATCLEALKDWADEVVIVNDEKCKDNTKKICESYGHKVITNPWKGFACQKAFAEQLCKNDWVLALDADEEVSRDLAEKLVEKFGDKELPEEAGFKLRWVTLYPGETKPKKHAHVDIRVRLYNKTKGQVKSEEFSNDDLPKFHTGTLGSLDEPVYHRTIINLSHLEKRYTQLTKEQAMNYVKNGKKISSFKFYTDFPFKFLKYYFVRRMYVHGWYGFTLSIMGAYRNFMRLAKTREIMLEEQAKNKSK